MISLPIRKVEEMLSLIRREKIMLVGFEDLNGIFVQLVLMSLFWTYLTQIIAGINIILWQNKVGTHG